MLFFNYDDISKLRKKAETTHKHIAEKIKSMAKHVIKHPSWYSPPPYEQFISTWNEKYGNNLCALSFYCLLYPSDTKVLEFVHKYVEVVVEYPTWKVKGMERDEMPISHTLVGVATAFDFLYPTFTPKQRAKLYNRIRLTSIRMFERFKYAHWGIQHLQNHVLNNCVALLIGALTVSPHYPQTAHLWSKMVIDHLNITTYLLDMIVDGSLNEGVTYSTYTTRSLTMFAFLAHRHFGLNYYENQWWEQHFWYLYHTLLPGYKEPLAIGDANPVWMYGPESQLVFLDSYVLKNGNGNWLASKINEHRESKGFLSPSITQKFATYHTEFIWYNSSIPKRAPNNISDLHIFSDWGVVTYGGGSPAGNTFLSFKSSKVHGMAINSAVRYNKIPRYIDGWSSFNAGHEHPDQNSFTFWPRGYPFITESYYSAKFSFLNSVLMFGPSNFPNEKLCSPPYEGQVGDCYKWFDWLSNDSAVMSSEIIGSFEKDGYVFISGEAAQAYREELKLKSVYRSLLLLTPDVLLVVDHIQIHTDYFLKNISAFFQMKFGVLEVSNMESEARLLSNDQDMYISWKNIGGGHGVASKHVVDLAQQHHLSWTQYLNVTFPINSSITRMAYVLHNSRPLVGDLKIHKNVDDGVQLSVYVDDKLYLVTVATNHSEVTKRNNWLGHLGYATLHVDDELIQFGSDTYSGNNQIANTSKERIFYNFDLFGMLLIINVIFLLGLMVLQHSIVSLFHAFGKIKWLNNIVVCLKVFLILYNLFLLCLFVKDFLIQPDVTVGKPNKLPIVFIVSLPFGGAQLYGTLLNKSTDIMDKTSEISYNMLNYVHPCAGRDRSKLIEKINKNELPYIPLITTSDSVWNYKIVKESSIKLVYVVTDAKSWIAEIISQRKHYNLLADLIDAFGDVECNVKWKDSLEIQEHLFNLKINNLTYIIDILAELWIAEVGQALHELARASFNVDYIIIKTEDLLSRPTETTELLFAYVGLSPSTEARNYALRLSRSRNTMPSSNLLLSSRDKVWEIFLTADQVKSIESRTNPLMKKLEFND